MLNRTLVALVMGGIAGLAVGVLVGTELLYLTKLVPSLVWAVPLVAVTGLVLDLRARLSARIRPASRSHDPGPQQ
jgi:hypothetical protein